jgi:hypothetical protein
MTTKGNVTLVSLEIFSPIISILLSHQVKDMAII